MREQVLAYLRSGTQPERAESLAIALFHEQRRASPLLAAMTERPDGAAADPQGWAEIPALPVPLFKELAIRAFDGPAGRIFLTSGTTGAVRGRHELRDTTVYDTASWAHFQARCGAVPGTVWSLCPGPDGESSLGHMVGHFAREGGVRLEQLFDGEAGIAPDAMARLGGVGFLAATAFSLDALFSGPGAAELTPESLCMVTGGFKGRRVRLDSEALYRAIGERLGSPRVVGEYGMTELSSQLWTDPVAAGMVPGAFVAPRWLHVYTVDPVTAEPTATTGLLRFVDLANTDSYVAIETMDLGRVERCAEGDRVTLLGRAAGAELRGCSLRAEDLLAAGRDPG